MNKLKKNLLKIELGLSAALLAGLSSLPAFAESEGTEAVSEAAADATAAPANTTKTNAFLTWLPIIIYIAIFILIGYFLLFRPQKKRKQQEEEMRSSLTLGDEVTTIGGICGKIVNIKDDNITIESSIDRTLMEIKNWAIRDVKKLVTDDEKTVALDKK